MLRVDPNGELDWVERDGQIVYDENVTSADDADLQEGDTYLGTEGFAVDEESGNIIQYNADGTTTEGAQSTGMEVTVTPSEGSSAVEAAAPALAVAVGIDGPAPIGDAIAVTALVGLAVYDAIYPSEAADITVDPMVYSKSNPKKKAREEAKKKREEQPASEDYAKYKAKQLQKSKGKDARRKAHDKKRPGSPDRSKKQLDKDYDPNDY